MKSAFLGLLSAVISVIVLDATLTPFVTGLFKELGIYPETWAAPTVRAVYDFLSSERVIAGLYGGLGAFCYVVIKQRFQCPGSAQSIDQK
ncbi:hypothetical protein [Shinella zoogloeoides]|uniref:Uncharacterized protein n=1 Tax=Shinella zoogloeoides TaxID=352475 RepID=A0A6N8TP09_SHIZO|nr:hypothetical protein [Shinella zoogloeoides]MXO02870.1 hypothetical protein [Shinella zoogloeoides]UEX83113.1 hypothetical protein K8M09_07545 [Shinella zoogloeoides]